MIFEPYVTLSEIEENLTILDGLNMYKDLDHNQEFFSVECTLILIKNTSIYERVAEDGLLNSSEIGYVFLSGDTTQYYKYLKWWANYISSFDILSFLLIKQLIYNIHIAKKNISMLKYS